MRRTGRPKTTPPKFMDGFYLEIKGSNGAVKIRRNSKDELYKAAAEYRKSKKVVILGEIKDGHWLSEPKELAAI